MSRRKSFKSGQKSLLKHLEDAEKRGLPAHEKTRVILFMDIVGYATFASRSSDDKALELVRRFENIARSMIDQHDGRIVMTAGDAIMACWHEKESLNKAAVCSREIMKALDDENKHVSRAERIRIRTGLHCGQALQLQDGDIIGNAVNLASRLQTAAKPGEILMSSEAAAIGKDNKHMPVCNKIGNMRLKGFDQAISVCCLEDEPKKQWMKLITDSFSSPLKLTNWTWGAWAFIIVGLLFSLGMLFTSPSDEFPRPELTAAGLFILAFGWAFQWASYRPRTISIYHPFFRIVFMSLWFLAVIFLGGMFGCWPS
jgi:class 3 adenylate cyclase